MDDDGVSLFRGGMWLVVGALLSVVCYSAGYTQGFDDGQAAVVWWRAGRSEPQPPLAMLGDEDPG